MAKAVVLVSGGIDSTTCLALAVKEEHEVLGLSFLYGQKHEKEVQAAAQVCGIFGCRHKVIRLVNALFVGSAITRGGPQVPIGTYSELQGQREGPISTYVPFRNGQLISAAAAVAVQEGASSVYFAAHADDHHRWAYPDCSPEFVGAMAGAVFVGTSGQVRLRTPLLWMTKGEVVALGHRLGVPFSLTWSCYAGDEKHCGKCPTCQERKGAFSQAKVVDPTQYME